MKASKTKTLTRTLKKAGCFLAAFAVLIGAACGIGMNFYAGEAFAGACAVVAALAAVPTEIRLVRYLLDVEPADDDR